MTDALRWEERLVRRALDGLATGPPAAAPDCDAPTIASAHRYCASVTRAHSQTFHLASALLPREKRVGARALYAFCRVSDDLVDRGGEDAPLQLASWRRRALAREADCSDPVAVAWLDARARFGIPERFAAELVDGVAGDLRPRTFRSFDDLADYCYEVGVTVGLMAMHVVGFAGLAAVPYAVRLGVALQLTNILRDVGEDLRMGRSYLPRDELDRFGAARAADLGLSRDPGWARFMRFQVDRTRSLYAAARPGLALIHPDGRFGIAAAADLYEAILDDIEASDWDVFGRRAHLDALGRLSRLPAIWWRSRSVERSMPSEP